MKPFLRPTDRGQLAPVGWVAEPAGTWDGRSVDVVYDPRRHQILRVLNDVGDQTRASIGAAGYRRVATDGKQELWARDRVEATQAALDRLQHGQSRERVPEMGRGL